MYFSLQFSALFACKKQSVLNQINITQFLRHYWLAKFEKVTEKKLYEKIKRHLQNESVYNFVQDLYEHAVLYINLLQPTTTDWKDKKTYESLQNLNILNYKAAYPVLLAGHKKFNEQNFRTLVTSSEKFIFKYVTIADHSPSDLENVFYEICKKIRSNSDGSIDAILDFMRKNSPDKLLFKQKFQEKVIKNQKVQRYILEKLNDFNGTGETRSSNSELVHIEHILPKSPDAEWLKYLNTLEGEYEDYINRIGNLTLLSGTFNREASNKMFTYKKQRYLQSEFNITNSLANLTEWNYTQIEKRQTDFAEQAITIWSI